MSTTSADEVRECVLVYFDEEDEEPGEGRDFVMAGSCVLVISGIIF